MFLDICKRHGLELDEEPSYGGRKYLEKQDYIRMKQKEEIADQQETILMQIDKVNENRLELAKQSRYVRANEEIIQSQEEKIKQQDTEFANNSDRIFKGGWGKGFCGWFFGGFFGRGEGGLKNVWMAVIKKSMEKWS